MSLAGDAHDLSFVRQIAASFPGGASYHFTDDGGIHRETQPRKANASPRADNAPTKDWGNAALFGYSWLRDERFLGSVDPPYCGAVSKKLPRISDTTCVAVLSPWQAKLIDSGRSISASGLALRPAHQGMTSRATTPQRCFGKVWLRAPLDGGSILGCRYKRKL